MTEKAAAKKTLTLKVKPTPKQPITNSDAAKRLYGKGDADKPTTKK